MDLEKLFFTQEDAAFIHEQSLKVLAETGCVFDDEKARNVLQKHGARVDGNVVYFTKELVEKGLSTVVDSLELYRPDGTIYQMGHGSQEPCVQQEVLHIFWKTANSVLQLWMTMYVSVSWFRQVTVWI